MKKQIANLKWAYTVPRKVSFTLSDGTKEYATQLWELDDKGQIKLGGIIIMMNFFAHKPTAAARYLAQLDNPDALQLETIN